MERFTFEHHTWAEVRLDALKHNFMEIKARAGCTPLCAIVKADAYGHGAVMVAKTLLKEGAQALAVSCFAEAKELREAGITAQILVLGHTEPSYTAQLIAYDITQSCYNLAAAQAFSDAALACKTSAKLKVHLKVDTGMGRIGFALRHNFDGAIADIIACHQLEGLAIDGVFQHFAVCDSNAPADIAYTEEQHALFVKAVDALTTAGYAPRCAHCNNSAGTLKHPEYPTNRAPETCWDRPGIILYGLNPSDEVTASFLQPIMQFKTLVSMVKTLEVGESTSYGRHFVAEKPTRVATLCAGYADGYPRLLSCGKGTVEIHGKPAKILGNVCMDQMMIDVTDIPDVCEGDVVTLWGGAASDSADEVGAKIGTIGYEIVCGVSRRVPRVYTDQGETVQVVEYLAGMPKTDA